MSSSATRDTGALRPPASPCHLRSRSAGSPRAGSPCPGMMRRSPFSRSTSARRSRVSRPASSPTCRPTASPLSSTASRSVSLRPYSASPSTPPFPATAAISSSRSTTGLHRGSVSIPRALSRGMRRPRCGRTRRSRLSASSSRGSPRPRSPARSAPSGPRPPSWRPRPPRLRCRARRRGSAYGARGPELLRALRSSTSRRSRARPRTPSETPRSARSGSRLPARARSAPPSRHGPTRTASPAEKP